MERLQLLIEETANSSVAISANGKVWFSTLGNTKKKFEDKELPQLCENIANYIEANRKPKVPTVRSPKLYTL